MSETKKVFKGFKLVDSLAYADTSASDKTGYLWFVKNTGTTETVQTISDGEQSPSYDESTYEIYFGNIKYGSYNESVIEKIKTHLNALGGEVDDIYALISGATADTRALISRVDILSGTVDEHAQEITTLSGEVTSITTDYKVKTVNTGDSINPSILSLNSGGQLSATIKIKSLNKEGGTYVQLVNESDEIVSEFDASEFVKDAMLSGVTFVKAYYDEGNDKWYEDTDSEKPADLDPNNFTKHFKFIWITQSYDEDGGTTTATTTQTTYLKATEVGREYEAGNGIVITTSGTTNEISVQNLPISSTLVGQDIVVDGGPLADDIKGSNDEDLWPDGWKNASGKKIIPETATTYDVLMNLFCRDRYPVVSTNSGVFNVTAGCTGFRGYKENTFTNLVNNATYAEVGQVIYFSGITAQQYTTQSSTNNSVTGLDNGYKNSKTGETIDEQYIEERWVLTKDPETNKIKEDGNYSLYLKVNSGFKNCSAQTGQTESNTYSGCTISGFTGGIVDGENKLSITATTPTYTATVNGIGEKFIVSQLGNVSDNKKSPSVSSATATTSGTYTSSYTVKGRYPMYSTIDLTTGSYQATIKKLDLKYSTDQEMIITYGFDEEQNKKVKLYHSDEYVIDYVKKEGVTPGDYQEYYNNIYVSESIEGLVNYKTLVLSGNDTLTAGAKFKIKFKKQQQQQ